MRIEATEFRPREVIKHVLQTAAALLKKMLIWEGHVADDVPIEAFDDVPRIRQIFTNLIRPISQRSANAKDGYKRAAASVLLDEHMGNGPKPDETAVWIRCDVQVTGIGNPETALPSLFKKNMQAGADTAQKYGGTGLGLAICKQLVELMGGRLTVSRKENYGSTFTFILPYKGPGACESSDENGEFQDVDDNDSIEDDVTYGFFQFSPRTLGTLFSKWFKPNTRVNRKCNW